MKKFYEAPAADELFADAPALLNDAFLSSNSDESEADLDWDLL